MKCIVIVAVLAMCGTLCTKAAPVGNDIQVGSQRQYIQSAKAILAQNNFPGIIDYINVFKNDLYPIAKKIIEKKKYLEIPEYISGALNWTEGAIKYQKDNSGKKEEQEILDEQYKSKIFSNIMKILVRLIGFLGKSSFFTSFYF